MQHCQCLELLKPYQLGNASSWASCKPPQACGIDQIVGHQLTEQPSLAVKRIHES